MTTEKRRVEVFTAACPSCEVQAYDLRDGRATNECREKAARFGVTAVQAVAVNGDLLDCCRREPITADRLIAAGIGQP